MKAIEEIVQSYDPVKLDTIKRLLEREAQGGKPRYYEIYLDNLKVVEKTNDPSKFDTYEDFLYEDVKEIKVQRYTQSEAAPRVISRHIFKLGEEKEESRNGSLNGLGAIEIEQKINSQVTEKVARERERWDSEQVKKELADTKQRLNDAEEYIETLQTMAQEAKQKVEEAKTKTDFAGIIKDLLPQFLLKKPSQQSLSGTQEKSEASFSRKTENANELSEDEKRYIELGKDMEERFNDDELTDVILIIQALAQSPAHIKTVSDLLNAKNK
jgi:hypothetical protein